MPPGERREYAGNAPPTTLTSNIDNATLTVPLTDATGWPTGVTGPFFVVLDKGLTTEEKIKCSSRTGNVLTVASGGRGVDGTAAASHSAGAAAEHVYTADDANLANQHYADATLDHHTQYLNTGRHASASLHGTANLDMVQLLDAIWPAGVIVPIAGTVPTTETTAGRRDWLPCDGAAVDRTVYSRLFAAIGTTYGTGDGTTTFNVPDSRGRTIVGAGAGTGLTARTNGQTFGAETVALALANLAAHSHTVNSHSHGGTLTTAAEAQDHVHNANHGHTGSSGTAGDHWHSASIAKTWATSATSHHHAAGRQSFAAEGTDSGTETAGSIPVNVVGTGNHTHTVTVDANNFNSGGRSASHNHTVAVSAEAPGTNSQGSGTAFNIMPPSLVATRMIKS